MITAARMGEDALLRDGGCTKDGLLVVKCRVFHYLSEEYARSSKALVVRLENHRVTSCHLNSTNY